MKIERQSSEDRKTIAPELIKILSERECQVLHLAARGLLDKEVCNELQISMNTLQTYWKRIRKKLGQENRAALVVGYASNEIFNRTSDSLFNSDTGSVIDAETMVITLSNDASKDLNLPAGTSCHISELRTSTHPDDYERAVSVLETVRSGEVPTALVTYRQVIDGNVQVISVFMLGERNADRKVVRIHAFRTKGHDVRPINERDD